ncbi:tRNA (adenosine(37)-N6)-dimethylallyltransferase MiaA [uncultured Parolsenella sp.]|uniref:tRNA (adenosine(37)-N6)-dimethylallyltransferase MiaA n=1 Tax=uncultured Parolsenella sp. TaxID=2083008 RepID=UPI0025D08008|nr:tRNA (adenosine(37)-N6)-dimethylallyltransferase MiaA [uncultured Parolsenella sp.]
MSEGRRGPVVCIVGPTASGKSSLSELVALELGSDVISVDSMQVYRGMDIGTAKTPLQERRVPLQMVDVVGIDEDYSVARFQEDSRKLIDERLAAGSTPVLCGGTGLYLDAVIDEMEFPTGVTHGVTRGRYEQMLEDKGARAIWDLLYERDPHGAEAIHPNNSKRVVRALEMLDQGVKYSAQLENLRVRKPRYDAKIWALTMDRDRLYARINQRVDMMVEQGLVSEVEGLVSRGYGVDLTARQAIGYKEILQYLDGEISLDEAVELIKRRTRRYAKRQLSWLRRDGRANWIDLDVVSPDEAMHLIVSDLRSRYRS